jgi:hypothetical protein
VWSAGFGRVFERLDEIYMNPAQRLITLLTKAKNHNRKATVKDGWAAVFGLERNNTAAIFKALVQALVETDNLERQIRSLEDHDHEILLEYLPRMRSVFSKMNLEVGWHEVADNLPPEIFYSLKICNERLERLLPEKEITGDDLRSLQDEINELLQRVRASNLKPKIRSVLADLMTAALYSINSYELRGAKGLREDLFVILSELQRHYKDLENQNEPKIVRDVWKVLERIDVVTSIATNVSPILTTLAPLLPPAIVESLKQITG